MDFCQILYLKRTYIRMEEVRSDKYLELISRSEMSIDFELVCTVLPVLPVLPVCRVTFFLIKDKTCVCVAKL